MNHIQRRLRDGQQIMINASELEGLMLQAGFTDVTTKRLKIEVGDWGPGAYCIEKCLLIDPTKHELGRRFRNIWLMALEALADQMGVFEDNLSEFVQGVRKDIENNAYQLYCYT